MKRKINKLICSFLQTFIKEADVVRHFKNCIKFRLYSKTTLREKIILVDFSDVSFGLADRLIGIMSLYMLAKEKGRGLKIHHTCEFSLHDYLIPNEINWIINPKDIAYGINEARPLILSISRKKLRNQGLPKLSEKVLQYHAYTNHDFREFVNSDQLKKYDRHILFHELFKPAPHLEEMLNQAQKTIGTQPYVAVHFRFMNFFEPVEKGASAADVASDSQQLEMIANCKTHLKQIHEQYPDCSILLFTDSRKFANASFDTYVKTLPGSIGHVSSVHHNKKEIVDKTFLDLMMMARATCIINVIGNPLRQSGFSRFAAEIGNITFITRQLQNK